MALAFAQNLGNLNTASATSLAGTFGSSTVSGNAIIAATRVGATGRTVTVSDSKTNSYAQATSKQQPTDVHELFCHYALNITGGASHQVTSSISGAATSLRLTLHEYSGVAAASALDQVNGGTGSDASPVSGNVTTTQADELLFGASSNASGLTITAGTGYVHLAVSPSAPSKLGAEDQIVSATGTYSATFTQSSGDDWACIIATFKAAGAGGSNKAIVPATITGTSTMSAAAIAKKTLTPATITGVSVMSAVVRSIDPVAPATITSTSTMSATVRSLDPVAPATFAGASTLSVALVFKRAVGAAVITGTSVLGGTIAGGSGTGHRHLAPSIVLTAAPAIAPKIGSRAFT